MCRGVQAPCRLETLRRLTRLSRLLAGCTAIGLECDPLSVQFQACGLQWTPGPDSGTNRWSCAVGRKVRRGVAGECGVACSVA